MKYAEKKPSYDNKRQILGEILPLSTPFNIIIDSSEACNFSCQYCFRAEDDMSKWGYAKDRKNMSWDIFTEIINQIKEFPDEVKQISLSGHGEPLCNRNVPNMVRYIKESGIKSRVSLHTNASLLTEEYAHDLADSDIDRIVVSLQGLSTEKYKDICGFDIDFNQFIENLSILYKRKKNTQIYYKIMDVALNNEEEDNFYEIFSGIGDRVYVEKMVPIWKDVDSRIKRKETECNKYGEIFPLQQCCPLLFHTLFITPIGDVYPCTQLLWPNSMGNITNNKLPHYWNCSERQLLLKRHLQLNSPDICKDCYILQNSIYTKEDMIDEYRKEIMDRMCNNA